MIQFPQDFFWGAALSAYQAEGNNIHSDWWGWEKEAGLKDASGEASRHYQLYREDFDLASSLRHNCHRLSVEWGRIEPEEGKFPSSQIQHYREVILSLRERHIEPVVTLHHFTNPAWFARLGGWENKKAAFYFLRYVDKIVRGLAGQVHYWVTINEPMVYIYHAYLLGFWPPQVKSFRRACRVRQNLADAHIRAYRLIRSIYREENQPPPLISIAKNMQAFLACIPTLRNKIAASLRAKYFNFLFVEKLIRAKALDFIGLNYYTRSLVEIRGWGFKNLALDVCQDNHSQLKKNSLGWDIYPEGLYQLLLELRRYRLPVFILENGISTEDDNLRWDFIYAHLKNIHAAMAEGVRVLGYLYWSLIDNFEWDKGFGPRFGLIEIDYRTYKRTARESAKKLALVYQSGKLD